MSDSDYEEDIIRSDVKLCISEFVNNIKKYIENPEDPIPLNKNEFIINKVNSNKFAYLAYFELKKQLKTYYDELIELIKKGEIDYKKFKQIMSMLMIIHLFTESAVGEVYFFNEGSIYMKNGPVEGTVAQEIKFRKYYVDFTGFMPNYLINDVQRMMYNFSYRAVDFTNARMKQSLRLGRYLGMLDIIKRYLKTFMGFYYYMDKLYDDDYKNNPNSVSFSRLIIIYVRSVFNDITIEKIKI